MLILSKRQGHGILFSGGRYGASFAELSLLYPQVRYFLIWTASRYFQWAFAASTSIPFWLIMLQINFVFFLFRKAPSMFWFRNSQSSPGLAVLYSSAFPASTLNSSMSATSRTLETSMDPFVMMLTLHPLSVAYRVKPAISLCRKGSPPPLNLKTEPYGPHSSAIFLNRSAGIYRSSLYPFLISELL